MPVTTTRRCKATCRLSRLLDVIDRVLHGLDLFGVLVRNLEVERFFELHHQLNYIGESPRPGLPGMMRWASLRHRRPEAAQL